MAATVVLGFFFTQTLKAATGTIDINTRYQMIEGFGAAGSWYDSTLVTLGSSQPDIYNVLFGNLGLDIYRIRNDYSESDASSYMSNTATIVANAGASLGHPIRVMISSWSPPAYLKNNSSTVGGTLAKDASGKYRYADFAQWWADSLTAWSNIGVNAYYISMQNEPDWTASWDTCLFDPTEDSTNAGYEQAFAALYTTLNSAMPNHPKLLAPEAANLTDTPSYIDALTATDKANIYGYAHHPYDGSADLPDGLTSKMATLASTYGSKPLLQTEFSGSGPFDFSDAMNLAILINNFMTVEGDSAYLYWELFWDSGGDALVTITSSSYTINPVYYAMKHYSYFTDPGWQRVSATDDSSDLRISAYVSPDYNKLSVVIINTNQTTGSSLNLSFNNFTVSAGSIYRTTSDQNCQYIGDYNSSSSLDIPAMSITTLSLSSNPSQFQMLNVSSTTGGKVSTPGQGVFQFPSDCTVTLIATPDIYYHFDCWSGSAVSAGKVADPCSANTTVFMDANYTLVANFALNPPDVTPPSPNPPVWESEPNAISSSAITMTVVVETDDNSPPVQYYFECVNDVNKSSSWQTQRTYTATGLDCNIVYSFRVKARDSYLVPNETNYSDIESAKTYPCDWDTNPPSPDPSIWDVMPTATDSNSIVMVAYSTTDVSGVEYYFHCLTLGGHDSGWQDSNTYQDTNLSPDTNYTYTVKARDKSVNHNETGWSIAASALTNYKILHRFTGLTSDGAYPYGNLLVYGDKFYGLTEGGGSGNGNGTLFRMNMDGSGFQVLYSFTGLSNSGWRPDGSLLLIGSKFYGLTFGGGSSGNGVVFSINPDGSNFQVLHSFAGGTSDGRYPEGSLTASGSTLFGFTTQGGSSGSGVLFKVNIDGSGYQVMHNFTNGSDGGWPYGTPLAVGSTVYGATLQGGTAGIGVLFKINADGSSFQVLRSFNFDDGGYPYLDGPILYNSMIYGMTFYGGSNYGGVIYKMNLDGTGYQIVYNFSYEGSCYPFSQTPARSGSVFYGTTAYGGSSFNGSVFMVNTNGTGYQLLHSFPFPEDSPYGSVYVSGSKVYGMNPGDGGYGSIYQINISPDFTSCPGIQAAGYRLESDLNGDCYVDYLDLEIIADNWLRNGCSPPDYCHGADFEQDGSVDFIDFSTFAPQWMQCNDPAVPGCIQNWP